MGPGCSGVIQSWEPVTVKVRQGGPGPGGSEAVPWLGGEEYGEQPGGDEEAHDAGAQL
jgi:hypothetical protein